MLKEPEEQWRVALFKITSQHLADLKTLDIDGYIYSEELSDELIGCSGVKFKPFIFFKNIPSMVC